MQNDANTTGKKKYLSSIDDSFDLSGLLLDYLSNIKYIILCAIISCIIAVFIYSTKVPSYQVGASIYLNDEQQATSSFALSRTPEGLIAPNAYIDETEIEILKSRNSIVNIVDTLGLAYSYYEIGSFKDTPIYGTNPVVAEMNPTDLRNLSNQIRIEVSKDGDDKYNVALSTQYKGVKENKQINTTFPAVIPTPHGDVKLSLSPTANRFDNDIKIVINKRLSVAQSIASRLNIEYASNSMSIIRITYNTPVIALGEDIITSLVNLYNKNIIEEKNRSAVQTEEFILDRLVMISSELKDVESRLEMYKRAHNIPTSVESQAAIYSSKSDATSEQLAQIDVQLQLLDEINSAVLKQKDYSPIAQICEDPELSSLIESYNKKVSQLQRSLETSTNDNPLIIKMKDDISREKSRIVQAIKSAKNNLVTRRRSTSARNATSAGQLASVPTIDKGMQEIFREQQVKVNIYTFLLQRREEIALQKALATPTAHLIDSPMGVGPISPKLYIHLFFGLLIGFVVPCIYIFVRRLVFPVFKDKNELSRTTDITILGEISHITDNASGVVVKENSDNSGTELFRLIRTNIEMVLSGLGKDKKVILTTSSLSGEGKSFCAANIAATFAIKGKKTLIIGADVRRPTLHRIFNVNKQPGLTNYLLGNESDYKSLLQTIPDYQNLYILAAGPIPPNPNELLSNGKLDELLTQARNDFDIIIIDSAPIGIVSDTLNISRLTDIQLYIARANYTKRTCINLVNSEIQSGRLSQCYLILNDVNITSGSYAYRKYGHYGHYGHYGSSVYSYGYGYESEKTHHKKSWWKNLFSKKKN